MVFMNHRSLVFLCCVFIQLWYLGNKDPIELGPKNKEKESLRGGFLTSFLHITHFVYLYFM